MAAPPAPGVPSGPPPRPVSSDDRCPGGVAPSWARRLSWGLCAAGAALVGWLVMLGTQFPSIVVNGWSTAWVGLDSLEAASLIATGWLMARHDPRARLSATAAATTLVIDAWFDVTTAPTIGDRVTALVMALLAELPLATVCVTLALRGRRAVPGDPRPTVPPAHRGTGGAPVLRPTRGRLWAMATVAAIALALTGEVMGAPAAAGSSPLHGRVSVPGTRPIWAVPESVAGPADTSRPITARVYLAGRDPQGLTRYAQSVSTPGSPDFRRYLSPATFQHRYGATSEQQAAVTRWLTSAGLQVANVTPHYVAVRGAVAAADRAFGVHLLDYHTPHGVRRAPDTEITVPAEAAPAVLAVTGLTTDPSVSPDSASVAPVSTGPDAGACSRYYGQRQADTLPPAYGHVLPYTVCGYEPGQIRSAYGVDTSGLDGAGTTVAVVVRGASPTITGDTDTYFRRHGLPPFRRGQFTQNVPADVSTCPHGRHWGEETLDIESVHAMAPGADIAYVAAGCATPAATEELDAETRIVDGDLASIVTNSWGSVGLEQDTPPGVIAAWERVFQQGAIEGIGFYFASGDQGDDSDLTTGHQPAVEYPQSDPWVTTVGGTSLAIDENGRYRWETGWGDQAARLAPDGHGWTGLPGRFDGGAGGGISTRFAQPGYQRGIVPDPLSHPTAGGAAMRVVPDIAADADAYTGMLIGMTSTAAPFAYQEDPSGGTSMAAPLIAGIQADAEQAQHGLPIGFANPTIYTRYHTDAYHDVTDDPLGPETPIATVQSVVIPGTTTPRITAVTLGHDTSLHATPGYDDVTGVGTPTRAYLDTYRFP